MILGFRQMLFSVCAAHRVPGVSRAAPSARRERGLRCRCAGATVAWRPGGAATGSRSGSAGTLPASHPAFGAHVPAIKART